MSTTNNVDAYVQIARSTDLQYIHWLWLG